MAANQTFFMSASIRCFGGCYIGNPAAGNMGSLILLCTTGTSMPMAGFVAEPCVYPIVLVDRPYGGYGIDIGDVAAYQACTMPASFRYFGRLRIDNPIARIMG